jgi:hypothetical protein
LFVPFGEAVTEDMQTNKDVNTEYSFFIRCRVYSVECRPFKIYFAYGKFPSKRAILWK